MISRMDDMCHLCFDNITSNPSFSFALCLKLRWSKNIVEEREAPQQIILGAMDPRLCVLLTLAAYVEFCHQARLVEESSFVFGAMKRTQKMLRVILQLVMEEGGISAGMGLIGTHSFQKGQGTYASRCGLSREVISKRGRWKNRTRMVDVYIDMNVPLPDATAAAKLCGPNGACKYKLRSNSPVSVGWLLNHVAPGCRNAFGADVAMTLALPLLWAAFDDYRIELLHLETPPAPSLDPALKERILEAYVAEYGVLGQEFENPVERVRVLPQGHGAQLIMVEMRPNDVGDGGGGGPRSLVPEGQGAHALQEGTGTQASTEAATAILVQQLNTHSCVEENTGDLMNELARIGLSFSRQFSNIHRAIKRIALQPVLRPQARQRVRSEGSGQELGELDQPRPQLYRGVRNLHDLWQEWEYGLAGNKAARDFTREERGKVKYVFSRRKVFWDMVSTLIRAGHTSDSAIDQIYEVYGRRNGVTTILQALAKDRRNGAHPRLRY